MKCPSCAQDNPENNHFCGQCGATLDEATRRLREQVRDLIRQEVRDEESLAVRVADKAEERLWKWGKILGICGALAAIALAAFGVTSFESAKKQIGEAGLAASQDLKSASEATKRTMEQKTTETIAQISKVGDDTIGQMQQEGDKTLKAANSVSLRVKASDTKMAEIERQQATQLNTLASIRTQSPDTPIGSISTDLFKSAVFGQGGFGASTSGSGVVDPCLIVTPPPPSCSSQIWLSGMPYKEGRQGGGVKEIQDRLAVLGCYSGTSTGTFDSLTAQAVDAFVGVNGRPSKDFYKFIIISSSNAPSALTNDDSAGAVDRDLWGLMFSGIAMHCHPTITSQ
jgi:hypothetical protein